VQTFLNVQNSLDGHTKNSISLPYFKVINFRSAGVIIIIISGFGIYGAAIVPDSGVGNTWQRLTLVLHEFLSNGLTPSSM